MYKEELYNKIDKFCNETDWGKYPTYEHALEEFIKGIVAEETKELEKENAELKSGCGMCYRKDKEQLTKAKVFIRSLKSLIEDVCDINYLSKDNTRLLVEAEQFLSEVENV